MAKCPECGAVLDIEADEVAEGEVLVCPECEADLEVVNTNPLEFDAVEEEEEKEEQGGGAVQESDDEEPKKKDESES